MPLWCTLVRKIQNNCFDQFTTLLLLSTAVCQSSFFYDILDHNIFLKPFSCFFLASLKLNPLTKTEIPGVEKVTLSITVMLSQPKSVLLKSFKVLSFSLLCTQLCPHKKSRSKLDSQLVQSSAILLKYMDIKKSFPRLLMMNL